MHVRRMFRVQHATTKVEQNTATQCHNFLKCNNGNNFCIKRIKSNYSFNEITIAML